MELADDSIAAAAVYKDQCDPATRDDDIGFRCASESHEPAASGERQPPH
jgi:hypothetical protein